MSRFADLISSHALNQWGYGNAGYPVSPYVPNACIPSTLAGGVASSKVTFSGTGQLQAFAFWDTAGTGAPDLFSGGGAAGYVIALTSAADVCTNSNPDTGTVGEQLDALAQCISATAPARAILALLDPDTDEYGTDLGANLVTADITFQTNTTGVGVRLVALPPAGLSSGGSSIAIVIFRRLRATQTLQLCAAPRATNAN